jgi:hypothetical protein
MMMNSIRIGFLFCVIGLLNGCSTAPAITESTVVLPVAEKVRSLEFVYHRAAMKTWSHHWQGITSVADLGFYDFSTLLVKEAPIVFANNHVAIVDAQLIEEDQVLNANSLPKGAGNVSLPVLIVEPLHGYESSNGHATMGGYVFGAQLINPTTHQIIWKASIDTNVWKGQDFLMKNIQKDVYDQSYADQFLTRLVTRLKEDGIVE